MSTTALQNVWQMLLKYDLSAANKRWLADHLYEQARKEEALPYTIEELYEQVSLILVLWKSFGQRRLFVLGKIP